MFKTVLMDETSTKATNLCVYFINRGQQVKGKLVHVVQLTFAVCCKRDSKSLC